MNPKAFKTYSARLSKLLSSLGAKGISKPPSTLLHFQLETVYGLLWISVEREADNSKTCTIFCRFEHPERIDDPALDVSRMNGKWNFHAFQDKLESMLDHFESEIKLVTVEKEVEVGQ